MRTFQNFIEFPLVSVTYVKYYPAASNPRRRPPRRVDHVAAGEHPRRPGDHRQRGGPRHRGALPGRGVQAAGEALPNLGSHSYQCFPDPPWIWRPPGSCSSRIRRTPQSSFRRGAVPGAGHERVVLGHPGLGLHAHLPLRVPAPLLQRGAALLAQRLELVRASLAPGVGCVRVWRLCPASRFHAAAPGAETALAVGDWRRDLPSRQRWPGLVTLPSCFLWMTPSRTFTRRALQVRRA